LSRDHLDFNQHFKALDPTSEVTSQQQNRDRFVDNQTNSEKQTNEIPSFYQQVFQNVNNLNDWDKPLGFPHNIPNSNTQKFVGRENELVLIHQHLQTSNHAVISAVEGMGGIGKTELATQYSLLHLFLNSYPGGICWLSATNQNLGLQIIQFCRTHLGLNPPDDFDVLLQVKWCWQRWREGKVLLVIDDDLFVCPDVCNFELFFSLFNSLLSKSVCVVLSTFIVNGLIGLAIIAAAATATAADDIAFNPPPSGDAFVPPFFCPF
jgi:hypothetical protein